MEFHAAAVSFRKTSLREKVEMPKPKIVQASSQTNSVDVSGTADFSVTIGGDLKGKIHHINLGNAVTTASTNASQQLASQTDDGDSATAQAMSQSNTFHANGDAAFHIVIEGNQKGAIHHIDVGSIVAALQSNTAIQFAVQAGNDSLLVQASWQSNTFDASGKATLVLVIEGDHKGAIHHISVGNTFVAIQANDSLQLAAQGGTGGPDVVQTTTQTNLNTATSEVEAALVVPPEHHGAISHLDAGSTIVAIQTNDSLRVSADSSNWQL